MSRPYFEALWPSTNSAKAAGSTLFLFLRRPAAISYLLRKDTDNAMSKVRSFGSTHREAMVLRVVRWRTSQWGCSLQELLATDGVGLTAP
jgi:hypothetical protein